MKAVVVTAGGVLEIEERPVPTAGPGEVVLRVGAAGICGTDLHIIDQEIEFATLPVVPGHELAGWVTEVGAGVTSVAVGDQVAVAPGIHCGVCRFCLNGRFNLCETSGGIGVTMDGGAAEYCVVPAANCHVTPAGMPIHAAALVEPLSCAIHGMDLLPRRAGEDWLIYGAGTMGLLMMQLALATAPASVSVVDTEPARLETAKQLGAHAVATSADDFARKHGWSTVVDCTGVVAAIEDGLGRVDKGGWFEAFGVARGDAIARFSPFRVYHDEIHIVGSMAVLHSFGRAVDVMATGVVDADVMVSDQLPLTEYPAAVEKFRARTGRKIMVRPDQG